MRPLWLFIFPLVGACAHSQPQAAGRICLELSYAPTQPAPSPKLSSAQKLPIYLELAPIPHPLAMPGQELYCIKGESPEGVPSWLLERANWLRTGTGFEVDWGTGLSGHRIHLTEAQDGSYGGTVDLYNDVPVPGANVLGLYSATATRTRCH